MSDIEKKLLKIPVIKKIIPWMKSVKLSRLEGMTLYHLMKVFGRGIINGDLTYKASAIAFSFFMAIFPFSLFILNLIPFIPIEGFQQDFLDFVKDGVPPNTFDAIAKIIDDILNNSYQGLLSWGFILSIFLMANGMLAILAGFEASHHITEKRSFLNQYLISIGMSILFSFILLFTVAIIVVFEVFIQISKIEDVFADRISFIQLGRYAFLVAMILISISIMFKFGTISLKKRKLISIGAIFTTMLIIISSYVFGIWVVKFSQYNELYGSIGTLLIIMFYIWINSMVLLLGFELNAAIDGIKKKHEKELLGKNKLI
jgi:membrane protein